MHSPRLSIVMATWNRAHMVGRAIEAVRAQTFSDWELIISDDGSEDNTGEVITEWAKKEPRIIYIRGPHQGIAKTYNQAFKLAKGEYIAMADDDDPWCDPKKLEKQVAFLDAHPDYVGCGGGMIVVNPEGKELYRYLKLETDAAIRDRMLFSNQMANSTTMFRRSVAEKIGWHDSDRKLASDRDFWLTMGREGKLYNFPEYFSYYTMSGTNVTIVNLRRAMKDAFLIMRKYKNDYPHYAPAYAFNFLQYLYGFIPVSIARPVHATLAHLRRLLVG